MVDNGLSVLQATFNAVDEAVKQNDIVLVHLLKEVISHLEHAGAVRDPTSLQERQCFRRESESNEWHSLRAHTLQKG